jgi:hypothetical protein
MTDVNHACGEVDVVPGEAEHFGEPQAGVCACEEQWPVAARAGGKETSKFCAGEDVRTRWSERRGCGRSSRSSRWKGCELT